MDEYLMYEAFLRGEYIPHEQIQKVTNFICGQLISWSHNRSFCQGEYNLATKLIIVCLWEKKDFPAIAKGGQTTVMTNLSIFLIMKNTKTVFVQYIKIYYRKIFSGK